MLGGQRLASIEALSAGFGSPTRTDSAQTDGVFTRAKLTRSRGRRGVLGSLCHFMGALVHVSTPESMRTHIRSGPGFCDQIFALGGQGYRPKVHDHHSTWRHGEADSGWIVVSTGPHDQTPGSTLIVVRSASSPMEMVNRPRVRSVFPSFDALTTKHRRFVDVFLVAI
jgi:hypothetical protein